MNGETLANAADMVTFFLPAMSKAFTKEEEHDAGAAMPELRARPLRSPVTAVGARIAREKLAVVSARLAEGLETGDRALLELERDRLTALAKGHVATSEAGGAVGFGAQVRLRAVHGGRERVLVIASADEVGLVPGATSATSPLARALLGKVEGDRVEIDGPRGAEELVVVDVRIPE